MMSAFAAGRPAAPAVNMQAVRMQSLAQVKEDLTAVGEAAGRLVTSLRAVAPHLLAYIPQIINIGKAMQDELTKIEERAQSQSGSSEPPETPMPSAELMGAAA